MKSCRRFLATASGAIVMLFFMALPVLAAEGAEPDPAESSTGLIFRWLNFALVFGGIGYLLAKHGGAFFNANAKAIAASIHEAAAAKAEADRALSEVNAKIARLDQEIAEMREAARRNWNAESERLRVSGLAEIEKINQAARAEFVASERVAQQQLREMAASMAIEQAGKLIDSRMNNDVRAKLFHSFLGGLGRSTN
jgi:F0F1-type ATP synthase membrane subunit b/b'